MHHGCNSKSMQPNDGPGGARRGEDKYERKDGKTGEKYEMVVVMVVVVVVVTHHRSHVVAEMMVTFMGVVEPKDMPLCHHHLLPLVRVTGPLVQEHDVRDMVFGQQRHGRRTRETLAVGMVQIDVFDVYACERE